MNVFVHCSMLEIKEAYSKYKLFFKIIFIYHLSISKLVIHVLMLNNCRCVCVLALGYDTLRYLFIFVFTALASDYRVNRNSSKHSAFSNLHDLCIVVSFTINRIGNN